MYDSANLEHRLKQAGSSLIIHQDYLRCEITDWSRIGLDIFYYKGIAVSKVPYI